MNKKISFLEVGRNWAELLIGFEKENPSFIKKLMDSALEELTPANIRNAICVRLHLSIKESAMYLSVSQYTIPKARNRLKKKLGLDGNSSLYLFILKL